MKCPHCDTTLSEVLETRGTPEGLMYRRRRACFNGHRFTTYEVAGIPPAAILDLLESQDEPQTN